MGVKLGFEGKLYRALASAWSEVTNVKDLSLSIEKGEADVTTRANAGWKATIGALKDASIEFDMVYDTADSAQTAFRNAFLNNSTMTMLIMDGDYNAAAAASQGLQCVVHVTKFELPQNLEEAMMVKVAIKPTYSTTPPAWKNSPVAAPT